MAPDTIKNGVVVGLSYTLTVGTEVIENAPADDPLEYLHGAENIVPGLEAKLTGKKVGDRLTVTLKPEEAYGEYDETNVEEVDRADMPDEIEVGMELLLEDEDGAFFEATVKQIKAKSVILDFNMPLAGETVTYDVEVLSIRPADEEELSNGHPHSYENETFDLYED
jgi:FKBP-type peptidyl-prolyl cis-trans isomerase SlyD